MRDDVVDIQSIDEKLRARPEFLLAPLRFLFLRQDIDIPARELGGEAHVLPASADGERELLVWNDDLDPAGILIQHHLGDLGWCERVDNESRGLGRPWNDVDLLALQLA